ncbi:hypothetical protein PR048_011034 [Dryococelus australis]|uniref:Uncharacterized protein n=1 Tax=Dryococelus australis TaxID=614101 RepID=A0ABQ9HKH2_9NEOP|nr:hypothetical protein PR048_011034 [Dryococelus australis]
MQQYLLTLSVQSSVAFYKRQLWPYNLTVHDCDDGQTYYLWHEGMAGRRPNEVEFNHVLKTHVVGKIKTVILLECVYGHYSNPLIYILLFINFCCLAICTWSVTRTTV